MPQLELKYKKRMTRILVNVYSYTTKKLKWLYSDDCIKYQITSPFGKSINTRLNAIIDCMNKKSMQKGDKLSFHQVAMRNESIYGNYSLDDDSLIFWESCEKLFKNFDCNHRVYFIEAGVPKDFDGVLHSLWINLTPDRDPSFVIESKARIDNIEYVTYVLGALGSWFGFSFLIINPFPYFITLKSESNENDQNSIPSSGNGIFSTSATLFERFKNDMRIDRGEDRQQVEMMNHRLIKIENKFNALIRGLIDVKNVIVSK